MKTKKTIYNVITMVLQSLVISLLSLITTSLIIKNYGSDFNGVVATAGQITNLLLIVEGGFSLAINVALYKPFVNNDMNKINSIMSAAKKIFIKIGLIFLALGTIVSLLYPLIIKSNLEYFDIFTIIFLVIAASAFNLIISVRCQILFQVSQKEYKYTLLGIITNLFSSLATITLVLLKVNMLWIRFSVFVFIILNGTILYLLYKKQFPLINTKVEPNYKHIKGTKDIMVQKLTSVIYLSTPLLYISTFINTKMASVYAVYYSIYNILKMFLSSIVAAPLNGFGQLLNEEPKEKVYEKFIIYEYLVLLISTILLSSIYAVIIYFIRIYTNNVTDINYINQCISYMIGAMVFFEIIHIPAGNIINVTAEFKVSKKIQLSACILLIILISLLGTFFNIYGVIGAMILTNIYLAFREINYVHKKTFNNNIMYFLKPLIVNLFLILICTSLSNMIILNINNYMTFFIYGLAILIINGLLIVAVNFVFFKNYMTAIFQIIKKFIKRV